MRYTATERWFFTADRREVVRESDPRAAFLYVGVGGTVPYAEAERYGIVGRPSVPTDAPDATAPTETAPGVETPSQGIETPNVADVIADKVITPKRKRR